MTPIWQFIMCSAATVFFAILTIDAISKLVK